MGSRAGGSLIPERLPGSMSTERRPAESNECRKPLAGQAGAPTPRPPAQRHQHRAFGNASRMPESFFRGDFLMVATLHPESVGATRCPQDGATAGSPSALAGQQGFTRYDFVMT